MRNPFVVVQWGEGFQVRFAAIESQVSPAVSQLQDLTISGVQSQGKKAKIGSFFFTLLL
jgi:hypothetical protein